MDELTCVAFVQKLNFNVGGCIFIPEKIIKLEYAVKTSDCY